MNERVYCGSTKWCHLSQDTSRQQDGGVLGESKHGLGLVTQRKTGGARSPTEYRTLFEEHSCMMPERVNMVSQRIPVVDEQLRKGTTKKNPPNPRGLPERNQ